MSFTRYKYDDIRVKKELQQSTGTGRYMLNTPGQGVLPLYYEDPHIRLQQWGANLCVSKKTGSPVDIASYLDGRSRKAHKYCTETEVPYVDGKFGGVHEYGKESKTMVAYTDETRASHPAWTYRTKEQTRWEYPLMDPQENTCMRFNNNISTRILEKDYFENM